MSNATPTGTDAPVVKVTSDGNPLNTQIVVNNKPLTNVIGTDQTAVVESTGGVLALIE